MDVRFELETEMLEALYPETQILENPWKEEKCRSCGETFADRREKQRHLREKHRGAAGSGGGAKKSFVCEVCGKTFSQRSGLSHHLPTHSGKSFGCEVCGKYFSQRSGLAHHRRTHSAVKAYTCETCGKAFAQSTGLIHHRGTHSAVKSFVCELCGKGFAQGSGLAHHRSVHAERTSSPKRRTSAPAADLLTVFRLSPLLPAEDE